MPFRGKDYTFNAYAAGNKVYGAGRSFPTMGPVTDILGYRERDRAHKAKRNAVLRRLKALQRGQHMNPDALGGQR